jgi:hypothetical protein
VSRQIPFLLSIIAIAIAGGFSGCSQKNVPDHQKERYMPGKTIEQVLNERTNEWMNIPGVEGVAIGEHKGKSCIRIFTSVNPKNLRDKIPSSVDGYSVIIEQTGTFRALEQED